MHSTTTSKTLWHRLLGKLLEELLVVMQCGWCRGNPCGCPTRISKGQPQGLPLQSHHPHCITTELLTPVLCVQHLFKCVKPSKLKNVGVEAFAVGVEALAGGVEALVGGVEALAAMPLS